MSPDSDAQQLLQLQQELRELERKHDEDIKDIRNAHESARRDASVALAAFMTIKMHDLSIDNMKLFVNTLIKESEVPVVEQGRRLEQLRKDFDTYVQGQQGQQKAQADAKTAAQSHRWVVIGGILSIVSVATGLLISLSAWITKHIILH